jgi:hypothetical protein
MFEMRQQRRDSGKHDGSISDPNCEQMTEAAQEIAHRSRGGR